MMPQKNLVTLVIPTRNRPHYLERVLDYYNSFQANYPIIVADSGTAESKQMNQRGIVSQGNLSITHLASYEEDTDFLRKIIDALNSVRTDYCLLCADDDFITPEGMEQSVAFLERNQDFTVAHGRRFVFYSPKGGSKRFFWIPAPSFASQSIVSSDSSRRLLEHFANYYPTFYSVFRTDFLKMILRETLNYTDDARFGEILSSALALVYGKMKCLSVLYGAYGATPNAAGAKEKMYLDFKKDGSYDKKYAKFKDCLTKHMRKNSSLDREESERIVDEAMARYLKRCDPDGFSDRLMNEARNILNRLPNSLSERIRALHIEFQFKRAARDASLADNEDFIKIKSCVMSHS